MPTETEDMIVRRVTGINRNLTPQQALDATGRKQFTDQSVVDVMPRGEGEEVDIYYFELDYDPTPVQLAEEYDRRGYKPDPIAQAKDNQDNPGFSDDRPNVCQWGLQSGVASFASFYRWRDERKVNVNRGDDRWGRVCRFGGVRK